MEIRFEFAPEERRKIRSREELTNQERDNRWPRQFLKIKGKEGKERKRKKERRSERYRWGKRKDSEARCRWSGLRRLEKTLRRRFLFGRGGKESRSLALPRIRRRVNSRRGKRDSTIFIGRKEKRRGKGEGKEEKGKGKRIKKGRNGTFFFFFFLAQIRPQTILFSKQFH